MKEFNVNSLGFIDNIRPVDYLYLVCNQKSLFTFSVEIVDNDTNVTNVEAFMGFLNKYDGTNYEIPGGEQTAINMKSMCKGDVYTVGGVMIFCAKSKNK